MPCFKPNQGFKKVLPSGKLGFTTVKSKAYKVKGVPQTMTTPCHRCEGCRFDYSREWAVKIIHESRMYFDGKSFNTSFITLTYNDDFIPMFGALSYDDHWRKFMYRLRAKLAPSKIRFYMIGEYGDLNLRPHYHAIIFGYSFPDRVFHSVSCGNVIYRSKLLEDLWTVPRGEPFAGMSLGYSSVGEVTVASAAYVARYNMKKLFPDKEPIYECNPDSGEYILNRYERMHPETGDIIVVPKERALMSNGGGSGEGGIGKRWFDNYALSDMYVKYSDNTFKDSTHLPSGHIARPPKYYDKLLERIQPDLIQDIKNSRQQHLLSHADSFTPERLAQRRECLLQRVSNLKRNIWRIYK